MIRRPLAGLAIVLLTACGQREVACEYREAAALAVNTDAAFRTLVRKDESQGIADLEALVQSVGPEENWLYVPAEGVWYETGTDEALDGFSSTYLQDGCYFPLQQRHAELVDYHPHRAQDLGQVMELFLSLGRIRPGQESRAARVMNLGNALPSDSDLLLALETARDHYRLHPAGSITFAIVSPYGKAELSFSREALARADTLSEAAIRTSVAAFMDRANGGYLRAAFEGMHLPDAQWDAHIRQRFSSYAQTFNNSTTRLTFVPGDSAIVRD